MIYGSRMDSLVDYLSSDEDSTPQKSKKRAASPTFGLPDGKKRNLPKVSASLISPEPLDDPSKHQGRIRTQPHVEGQFASYIYVPVNIGVDGIRELSKIVKQALDTLTRSEPLIHPMIKDFEKCITDETRDCELHISLSRPVYLFHQQREMFKQSVKSMASSHATFSASFASFTAFENDEKTRAFVAMEIGAGHSELRKLVDHLTPTLRGLYQKEYYSEPRFHASIAWALLKTKSRANPAQSPPSLSDTDVTTKDDTEFPTLSSISPEILTNLNNILSKQLSRITFEVDTVKVRIGKQTTTFPLRLI